ncbi:signal peptidase I [Gallaecimonas sp. GXIMD4217]|uniref:signal peptidase I n=1 Tax=Gallaecimonas sp. GXIMD4217 TaxID=3131927 RepID=UPI00311ACA9A
MAQYFSILLVVITLGSGLIWLADRVFWAPRRRRALDSALAAAGGELDQDTRNRILAESGLVEQARGIFPVIAVVLVLRSFLYEPFQIPTGSMMPTLLVGDFILVEKYAYGIKDPVWRKQLVETGSPERGDIAVFKYPEDPSQDYIKRVIGLPGDRVIYRDKQLYIKPACAAEPCPELMSVPLTPSQEAQYYHGPFPLDRYVEQLGEVEHDILVNPAYPDRTGDFYRQRGTRRDEWLVPEDHYFMVGDNRDNSRDSRFWGFVPKENLVGKAVFIWMSFERDRDPEHWLPNWVPTGVRLDRLGRIE